MPHLPPTASVRINSYLLSYYTDMSLLLSEATSHFCTSPISYGLLEEHCSNSSIYPLLILYPTCQFLILYCIIPDIQLQI